MKPTILNNFRITQLLAATGFFAMSVGAHAAAKTWIDANANNNWSSTDANWTGPTAWTSSADSAIFGGLGGATGVGETVTLTEDITTVGLIVNNNNATGYTFNLGSGIDLVVNGNVTIGANLDNSTTKATFTGLGSFSVTNSGGTFQVGGATSTFGTPTTPDNVATLDMSGLANFSADLGTTGTFRVGDASTSNDNSNTSSTAILAQTSIIKANRLDIGATTSHGDSGAIQTLKLGSTANTINANVIDVGGSDSNAQRASGEISFNSSTGTLKIRSANDTVNGRANMNLVNTSQATGVTLNGTVNLTGHESDLRLGTLTIAVRTGAGAGGAVGTFSFDTGTLDVTNITLATRTGNNIASTSTGTVNIGGGIANIGGITMASAALGKTANATINLTGGVTTLGGNITKTGGTGTTSAIINLDGGTLDMGGFSIGGANVVTLNAKSGTLSNLGQLNSGGTLTKTTGGTLILSGTNSYTGTTSVTAGTLLVNGSTHISSAVSVDATGTLGGTGAIGGTVTVNGTLKPGASIESLATGSVSMGNGSMLDMEIQDLGASGADLLNITGNFTLTGTVHLNLTKLGVFNGWLTGDKITLAHYDGTWNGGFLTYSGNELLDGEQFSFDSQVWAIDYDDTLEGNNFGGETSNGGSNRFLTLTVVPEPSVALLGGLGALGLLRRRRR